MIVERRLNRLPSGKSFTGLKHINSALIETRAVQHPDKSV